MANELMLLGAGASGSAGPVAGSSGPNAPGTLADNSTVGTVAWLTPGNAAVSDNNRAGAAIVFGEITHYLLATNFGFSVPGGATVTGIVVGVERRATLNAAQDSSLRLFVAGVVAGDNRASGDNWPINDVSRDYGSNSDLWGLTLAPSDVNSAGFGVGIAATTNEGRGAETPEVDFISITVYYTT